MRLQLRIILFFLALTINCTVVNASFHKSDSLLRSWYDIKGSANDTLKIQVLQLLGDQFKYSQPDSGMHYFNIALEIAEKSKLNISKAYILIRIGFAKYVQGEYDLALEYFLQALSLFEKENYKRGIALGFNNMGLIYNMQEKYKEAVDSHQKSIEICQTIGDSALWCVNLQNIGIAYNTVDSLDSALYYANKSLEFFKNLGLNKKGLVIYNLRGEIFIKKGEYQKAINDYMKIINYPGYDNKWEICYALAGLADTEKHLGNPEKSIEYALQSYNLALEIGAKWDLQKVTGILAESYAMLQDWEKAYHYHELFKAYSDSIFNEKKEKEINYLQLQKKHEENELLAAENQLKQQRIERKNAIIYGIVSGSVLLCMIVFVLYRNNILKTRLNRELRNKSATIAAKNKELTELNATKDRLFRIISHDLKSPVSTLVSFTDLLIENYGQFDEKTIHELLLSMNKSSKEGLRLLENLLDWARSQTGSLLMHREDLNLAAFTSEVVELFVTAASVKSIGIDNAIPDKLIVHADRNMLAAIIRNLISNAIKYTADGGKISVEAGFDTSVSMIEIAVSDNGIGIKKENMSRIFQLDEQHTTPGTNDENGTGLGLLICKEFVEKQGGKIKVESQEGKGSKFTFTLPGKMA